MRLRKRLGFFGTLGALLAFGCSESPDPTPIPPPTNQAPIITPVPDQTVDEGQLLTFTMDATDPEGSIIKYSMRIAPGSPNPLPPNATMDQNSGVFTLTPGNNAQGTSIIYLVATDILNQEAIYQITLIINDIFPNTPPGTITLTPSTNPVTIDEGQTFTLDASATDPDGDPINYTVDLGTIDSTGAFSYTPGQYDSGTKTATFTASDSFGGSTTITLDFIINNTLANRPPTIDPISDITVDEGQPINFTVNSSDLDGGDTTTVTATGLPTGATFNSGTRTFDWTSSSAGTYTIIINSTDGSLTSSELVTLTINNLTYLITFDSTRDTLTLTNKEIYTMNEDGSNIKRLTTNTSNDGKPTWSPDRLSILKHSNEGGNWHIESISSLDGSGLISLINSSTSDQSATYSSDGNTIYLMSKAHGGASPKWQIYKANSDGTNLQRILITTYNCISPKISPDGTTLTFYGDKDGNNDIFTVNVDGTNLTQITIDLANEKYPVWYKDGRHILTTSNIATGTNDDLWKIDKDGINPPIQLTSDPENEQASSFSPDGTKFVYQRSNSSGGYDIWMRNTDGTMPNPITMDNNTIYNMFPSWNK